MRVLVACEFSGIVREAFRARGHEAWSCDLLPTEIPSQFHIQGDVRLHLYDGIRHSPPCPVCESDWDLMIAHPPCTHLAVSGARWFKEKTEEQTRALDFVKELMNAPIEKICIENPVSIISSKIRQPDQTIQPWQFGHGETKATCLWLKGLPKLAPTHTGDLFGPEPPTERVARIHNLPPSPDRWKERSRTFQGIAKAMAEQWG